MIETKKYRYTKDAIRSRIFKLATTFWNVPKIDNLDPLVKLLIESIAEEIHNISDDVSNLETRLLEKLANILTPDLLIAPSPAHGIIHAQSIEPTYILERYTPFLYTNPVLFNRYKLQNILFSPVCNTKICNGNIKYLIINGLLYKNDDTMTKQLVARPDNNYYDSNTVWIGLDLDKQIKTLKDLSFYIDFPNTTDKNEYLYLLPFSTWTINGQEIKLKRGIYQATRQDDEFIDDTQSMFFKYEISSKVDDAIMRIYENHYMQVVNDVKIGKADKTIIPNELKNVFSEEVLDKQIENPVLWVAVTFPVNYNEMILEDLQININAIPVANKSFKVSNNKVDDIINIIPLKTDDYEYFLSVESVKDSSNKNYYEITYNDARYGEETGTYSVRHGGCERFDSRSAKDFLAQLSDLLNDERAVFSRGISKDNVQFVISDIDSNIVKLQHQTNKMDETREMLNYILLDNISKTDFFDVAYWTTNCELANNIRTGADLSTYASAVINTKSIVMLSTTYGGKKEPKAQERLNMYKYVLTTGSRIVTVEDIKNFCRMKFSQIIADVDVKKGVAVSNKPKEGLIRTIDVYITLRSHLKEIENNENLKGDIKNELIAKSPDTYNYRVFITTKEKTRK